MKKEAKGPKVVGKTSKIAKNNITNQPGKNVDKGPKRPLGPKGSVRGQLRFLKARVLERVPQIISSWQVMRR